MPSSATLKDVWHCCVAAPQPEGSRPPMVSYQVLHYKPDYDSTRKELYGCGWAWCRPYTGVVVSGVSAGNGSKLRDGVAISPVYRKYFPDF